MVLNYSDTKLAHCFIHVEPIATACLGARTGTPTGSKMLGATEGLEAWMGCTST